MTKVLSSAPIDLPAISKCDRIEADLRARIQSGEWAAGMMLPSRRKMVKLYNVDLSTVQRALAPLITDGTLQAQAGRGTFVARVPGLKKSSSNGDEKLLVDEKPPVWRPKSEGDLLPGPRSLRSKTIGIIGRPASWGSDGTVMEFHWAKAIINALERSITGAGGATRLYNISRQGEELVSLREAIRALHAEKVDGIAVILDYGAEQVAEAISALGLKELPFIFVGQGELRQPVLTVYYDNRDAGQQAASHLLENGCRSLLFFTPYSGETDWEEERLTGVREAILFSGLSLNCLQTSLGDCNLAKVKALEQFVQDARDAASTLLASGLPAQGIIAANDYFAQGFICAAAEQGWDAGKDYAIVGFDDAAGSQALGLTSLHPPLEGMGQEAGRMLGETIAGSWRQSRVCLQSDLVARTSSRLHFK